MPGTIALHGGGEFLPGDEPFLEACLRAAIPAAHARVAACTPARSSAATDADPDPGPGAVRALVVPAAAARQRPGLAAGYGVEALRAVAARAGIAIRCEAAMVVDAAAAASPSLAARLAGADLVHLPGGDPGVVLDLLDGSAAWHGILAAMARGAVVAGASAGAMALAGWCWTPTGWRHGLGAVPGLVVVPHAERVGRGGWAGTFGDRVPAAAEPLGRLGLDERTGVLAEADPAGDRAWRVVGPGRVHWSPDGATPPRSVAAPTLLRLAR